MTVPEAECVNVMPVKVETVGWCLISRCLPMLLMKVSNKSGRAGGYAKMKSSVLR